MRIDRVVTSEELRRESAPPEVKLVRADMTGVREGMRSMPKVSPWQPGKLGWVVRKLLALKQWGDERKIGR